MNNDQLAVVKQCSELSQAGKIHFGDLVQRLVKADIERYHADYTRAETTFYTPENGSCVVPMGHALGPIGDAFSAQGLQDAIGQAQRGEIMYPQFTRQVLDAGCVGYFVQLRGRCAQYFGRRGEIHTERFPDAPK